jgi:hypothetical protein
MDAPSVSAGNSRNSLNIAIRSALASALCLGLPAGSIFWLLIVQRWLPLHLIDVLINFFQYYSAPLVILEMLGAFGWGLYLGKISGYRQWWWLSMATMAGVLAGFLTLYNGFLQQLIQAHVSPSSSSPLSFGLILCINILCVTITTGLLLGLTLLNWKASLILAASTGITSVVAAIVVYIVLGRLGIRVGSGNASMPKVTAASTMVAALAGGAVLGVIFTRYVRLKASK